MAEARFFISQGCEAVPMAQGLLRRETTFVKEQFVNAILLTRSLSVFTPSRREKI
jgi:hypothetical protein